MLKLPTFTYLNFNDTFSFILPRHLAVPISSHLVPEEHTVWDNKAMDIDFGKRSQASSYIRVGS